MVLIATHTLLKIVSSIADNGQWEICNSFGKVAGSNASKIWHLLRSLDSKGSGQAVIEINDCVKFFEVQPRTIYRWLKSGLKLGFFRSYKYIGSGQVQVYYSSLIKLACKLGIHNIGAIAEAPISALKNLKQASAIATALDLQRRSAYRAKRKKGLGERLDLSKAFGRTCGHGSRVLARTPRYIYLSDKINAYGGSQKRAAWEQRRHVSTNQRRLSNLSPLNKRQLAQASRENLKEYFYKLHCDLAVGKLFRHPDYPNLVFKAGVCVYHFPDWTLIRCKYLRAKVKRALQAAKNSHD